MKIACAFFGLVLVQCGALYAASVSSSSSSSSDGRGGFVTQQSSNVDGIERRQTLIGDDYGQVAVIDSSPQLYDDYSDYGTDDYGVEDYGDYDDLGSDDYQDYGDEYDDLDDGYGDDLDDGYDLYDY